MFNIVQREWYFSIKENFITHIDKNTFTCFSLTNTWPSLINTPFTVAKLCAILVMTGNKPIYRKQSYYKNYFMVILLCIYNIIPKSKMIPCRMTQGISSGLYTHNYIILYIFKIIKPKQLWTFRLEYKLPGFVFFSIVNFSSKQTEHWSMFHLEIKLWYFTSAGWTDA